MTPNRHSPKESDGSYQFDTLQDFVNNSPAYLYAAYDRTGVGIEPVPYNRSYQSWQFDVFAQDDFRATPRLTFSYGIRYDRFGAPVNVGPAKDSLLALGPGSNFIQRLQGLNYQPITTGNEPLFNTDNGNVGPRFGVSYDAGGTGQTIVRGSYGIFYDRPFDNLWQIVSLNSQIAGVWSFNGPVTALTPPLTVAAEGTLLQSSQYHTPQLFQPDLRNPMIQSAFVGIQQKLTDGILLEVNALTSLGRRLWTTDDVNRFDSVIPNQANPNGRYNTNPEFADIDYLGNQGASDYTAFTSALRFHRRRLNGQISYTLSHSIDNQSDPLAGIFEDYNQAGIANKPDSPIVRPASHASSTAAQIVGIPIFDQRRNLVFFAVYSLPTKLLRGWEMSGLGAIRSGLALQRVCAGVD